MTEKPEIKPLAYRPREAAAAMGISERRLRDLMQGADPPPSFRIEGGNAILFPVRLLEKWLTRKAQENTRGEK